MLDQADFQAILADQTKRIERDIVWAEDPDHLPARGFRVELRSDPAGQSSWSGVTIASPAH
ncbi:hypothetical protein [Chloroflexus sp.]|uniref:hypothetical protein n=1 Tax=Chloroflexus sp. TaxID=1904827 RepID=UPI002ACD76B2|nr:hypothetical protein [Chloroflexus sp.]